MIKKIDTVLVGLGSVGFAYDLKQSKSILSHLKSLLRNRYINLVDAVDRDNRKLKILRKEFNIKGSKNLSKSIDEKKPKLIVISVNTENIFKVFQIIKSKKFIKYVILEKPGASNFKQLLKIYKICEKKKIILLINYNRAYFNYFLNNFKFLKKAKNFKVIYYYSRGLYNSASHFLNLVFHFLEMPKKISIISKNKKKKNYNQIPDLLLTFDNGKIYLLSSDHKDHLVNEGIMFAQNVKKTVDLNFSKITSYQQKPSKLIKNFKFFEKNKSFNLPNKNNQLLTLDLMLKKIKENLPIQNFKNANLKTIKLLDKIEKKLNY